MTLFARPPGRSARAVRDLVRAPEASDVRRVRVVVVAAAVAAACALLAWLLWPLSSPTREAAERSPGPLARPHVVAGLTCDKCHGEGEGKSAKAACKTCHGAHPSTRSAHRALAANGQLGCVTCHPAHGAAQGVTFLAGETYVRWGNGEEVSGAAHAPGLAGVTVPLVAVSACARCHDLERETDPALACARRGDPISSCFDEHVRDTNRFVAWEAARSAARDVPWVAAPKTSHGAPFAWLGIAALGASLAFTFGAVARARRTRTKRAPAKLSAPVRVRLPQINAGTCLGCYACVDACPFDVLTIDRYLAVVERPADCCGVGTCEQACPNGSLVITEGEPIEERPRVGEDLESEDAPGVFVAGDLTGLPLIKNAIAQGARAVDAVAKALPKSARGGQHADVVIVGAGPAGLSAALRAKELSLSYVVLEQGSMAESIRSFPRDKLVFDPPLDMPVEGPLWLREATKEELLAQWTRIVRRHGLTVREGHRVTGVVRDGDAFLVTATGSDGEREFRGKKLVLAVGRRGTPRPLGAEIADDAVDKVSYALADARSFAGKRVLVVGLGDAAMEAACAVARQPGAEVTISYRGKTFARGKARNIAEVKTQAAAGRVRVVFESRVLRVDASSVTLDAGAGEEILPNDAVLVLIGGVPSWDLVEAAGVRRALRADN